MDYDPNVFITLKFSENFYEEIGKLYEWCAKYSVDISNNQSEIESYVNSRTTRDVDIRIEESRRAGFKKHVKFAGVNSFNDFRRIRKIAWGDYYPLLKKALKIDSRMGEVPSWK